MEKDSNNHSTSASPIEILTDLLKIGWENLQILTVTKLNDADECNRNQFEFLKIHCHRIKSINAQARILLDKYGTKLNSIEKDVFLLI